MNKCEDITSEYISNATPNNGDVIKEQGYNSDLHSNEIAIAEWIVKEFGGNIVLLNEKNLDNVKTPDFLWHDRFWDLKDVSSAKAIDNAVRKGLHQIQGNPGGIILDFKKNAVNLPVVTRAIEDRLRRGFPSSVDFIIISKDKLLSVLRYKK